MAKSRLAGEPMRRPSWSFYGRHNAAQALATQGLMNSSGDRTAYMGHMIWSDGGSHDAHIIHFRVGSSSSPSFTLRVSLQDVNTAAGPPGQPDGTVDQSATQVNPTATTYGLTLDADRTMATGALIAVVFDFSAYTSGSMRMGMVASHASGSLDQYPTTAFFDGATWTAEEGIATITIEAADGTMGHLEAFYPRFTAVNVHTYNSGSATSDEYAMAFTVAAPMWACSMGAYILTAAGGDFSLILYEGTTAKATVAIDASTWRVDASRGWVEVSFPDVALTVGNTYYVSVLPTTANNVAVYSLDVSAAGHLTGWAGTFNYATRIDAGSWAAVTTTRILQAYIGICAVDDAAGGSGGGGPLIGGRLVL